MSAKMTLMDEQTKCKVKSKTNSTDRRFLSCWRDFDEFLISTSLSDNTKTFFRRFHQRSSREGRFLPPALRCIRRKLIFNSAQSGMTVAHHNSGMQPHTIGTLITRWRHLVLLSDDVSSPTTDSCCYFYFLLQRHV